MLCYLLDAITRHKVSVKFTMYIEFLHCNACFTYSSSSKESQIQFWLTECGHVACKACLNKNGEARQEGSSNVAEHTCPVCNTRCAAVELTDNVSHYTLYFDLDIHNEIAII
ncbi:hypothetical protein RclHR1_08720001 [Rhizophagus clarus]|uniref:RING-type domain-containing protein n=1 Tax=Rhizophagus clarus TaxID=94130 RepID=A0A2Z6S1M5_9GLOM|nr:hypothetical protein RclHR1_02710020 [Rhizophagus clarus]GBC09258.1 hypothetical protein RclHR1_08720001 [Rhizophagus clarus]